MKNCLLFFIVTFERGDCMCIDESVEYIKNELKSYVYLKNRVIELREQLYSRIIEIDEKLEEIREELDNASAQSPGYEEIQFNGNVNADRTLNLIIKEQELNERKAIIEGQYNGEIKSCIGRIENIDMMVEALSEEDRALIVDLYFNKIGYKKACNKYFYSRQGMYKCVVNIIKKMIKNSKK